MQYHHQLSPVITPSDLLKLKASIISNSTSPNQIPIVCLEVSDKKLKNAVWQPSDHASWPMPSYSVNITGTLDQKAADYHSTNSAVMQINSNIVSLSNRLHEELKDFGDRVRQVAHTPTGTFSQALRDAHLIATLAGHVGVPISDLVRFWVFPAANTQTDFTHAVREAASFCALSTVDGSPLDMSQLNENLKHLGVGASRASGDKVTLNLNATDGVSVFAAEHGKEILLRDHVNRATLAHWSHTLLCISFTPTALDTMLRHYNTVTPPDYVLAPELYELLFAQLQTANKISQEMTDTARKVTALAESEHENLTATVQWPSTFYMIVQIRSVEELRLLKRGPNTDLRQYELALRELMNPAPQPVNVG